MNPRVLSLNQSNTLKLTALTKKLIKEGKDVVNFAAGEPDFDTPDFIKEEAVRAISEGFTKYTPSAGTVELREAIIKKLREENNLNYETKNIIVTSGAKYAIFAAILTASGKGDEVIIPAPYWVSYPEMVGLAGAKAKFIKTRPKDNFRISIDSLNKAITKKTRMLILNYPNNPTGATYDYENLKEIYETVKDKNIFVLSDEIYETLTYDGKKHFSFASFPGAGDYTITINGFSKAFSMTGWRLGYLAAGSSFVEQASKVIDHTTSCASSIAQRAATAAFRNRQWADDMVKEFEKRRNILFNGLSHLKKITPLKPEGTFYMFCDIKKTGLSSLEFSSRLLDEQLVSVIPADSFGAEGFARLSFATSMPNIEKGIERIKKFLG